MSFFEHRQDAREVQENLCAQAARLTKQDDYELFQRGVDVYKKAIKQGDQTAFREFKALFDEYNLGAFVKDLSITDAQQYLDQLNIEPRHFEAQKRELSSPQPGQVKVPRP